MVLISSKNSQLSADKTMTKRICVLRDIYLHICWDGNEEFYRVGPDGLERGEPVLAGTYNGDDFRKYVCANCGAELEGESENADVNMREHIGRKHKFEHPFNLKLYGA